jgi:hypothetical protein
MKLTIENYNAIKSYFTFEDWRIADIEETDTQYHFELKSSYGTIIDIQLERDPISGNETTAYQFEFWGWRPHKGTTRPEREFLYYIQVKNKDMFCTALIDMIKKWIKTI